MRRGKTDQAREALAEKAETAAEQAHVKERLSEGISQVKEKVAETKDHVIDEVKQAAPESANEGAHQLVVSAQRKPVPFAAAGALALGLLLGWLVGRR
jgi:ElaB/YqjD/DUF883 family membrane-anchored ribosome-binding protein